MAESTEVDYKKQNNAVRRWASAVERLLAGSARRFINGKKTSTERPGRTEKKLAESIRKSSRSNFGQIDRVLFYFERHGVFVHKGVGRGYKMKGGVVVKTASNSRAMLVNNHFSIHDRINAREKMGVKTRHPSEWFNPVLNNMVPELANKIAEINVDAVVNATRMMIK